MSEADILIETGMEMARKVVILRACFANPFSKPKQPCMEKSDAHS